MGCGKLDGGGGWGACSITRAGVRFWAKILKRSGSGSISGAPAETNGGGNGGGY